MVTYRVTSQISALYFSPLSLSNSLTALYPKFHFVRNLFLFIVMWIRNHQIMQYFISILEHCTQLNYTLHSKYHTYIRENFKKIRIEKSIIQNCNWQMMFGLEEEFFSLCIKKLSIDLMTHVWVWKKWSFFHSNIEKLVINHVFWHKKINCFVISL